MPDTHIARRHSPHNDSSFPTRLFLSQLAAGNNHSPMNRENAKLSPRRQLSSTYASAR